MPAYTADAIVGVPCWVPFPAGVVTGITLGDLTSLQVSENGQAVDDPVVDLGLALFEVDDVGQPGVYFFRITPSQAGTLFFRFTWGGTYEYVVNTAEDHLSDASLEGDYTVTVEDGLGPVEAATVRVYDAAGTHLVQRGVTDSAGEVTFYGLLVGTYQTRVFKEGYDFSAINPTSIYVTPDEGEAPHLEEVLPVEASIGDVIALHGTFFNPDDTRVHFGAEAAVDADVINVGGTLLLVEFPVGVTATVVALRVSKPDPAHLPSGRLYSNIVTLVRV